MKRILPILLLMLFLSFVEPVSIVKGVVWNVPSEGCSFVIFYYEQDVVAQCYSDFWAAPDPSYGRGYFLNSGPLQLTYSYPFYFSVTTH